MIPGVVAQGFVKPKLKLLPSRVVDNDTFFTPFIGIPTVWDAATASNVSLSGANLVAQNLSSGSAIHGVKAHPADYKDNPNGNFYFEVMITNFAGGSKVGIGVGDARNVFSWADGYDPTGFLLVAVVLVLSDGKIYDAGHQFASPTHYTGKSLGALTTGDVIGVAFRANSKTCYFKKVSGTPSGWNAPTSTGEDNPATDFGPTSVSEIHIPLLIFGGSSGATGNILTANFGGSPFVGTVPAGYTRMWPINPELKPSLFVDTDVFRTPNVTQP